MQLLLHAFVIIKKLFTAQKKKWIVPDINNKYEYNL